MYDLFTSREHKKEKVKRAKTAPELKKVKEASFKRFNVPKDVRNNVQWNTCKTMCLNLRTFVKPRYLCLCCAPKNSREQKLEVKSFKHIMQEVSIVNILKQLRVLKAAVKSSLPKHEWKMLNDSYALMAYSDLDSDSKAVSKFRKVGSDAAQLSESISF